jgi:hypothetical protein
MVEHLHREGARSILCLDSLCKGPPRRLEWMTPEAAARLECALTEEQDAVKHATRHVGKALLRPDLVVFAVQFFFWILGVHGSILWLPLIVRQGSALSTGRTGLLGGRSACGRGSVPLTVSHVCDRKFSSACPA